MSLRRSGLQTEVFSLYRRALRMVNSKPPATQPKFQLFVRHTFRVQAESVSPRDVGAIEYLLRRGKRQLEMYEDPAITDCWVSEEMRVWEGQHRKAFTPNTQSSSFATPTPSHTIP